MCVTARPGLCPFITQGVVIMLVILCFEYCFLLYSCSFTLYSSTLPMVYDGYRGEVGRYHIIDGPALHSVWGFCRILLLVCCRTGIPQRTAKRKDASLTAASKKSFMSDMGQTKKKV